MARTELDNGVILPAEYSDDWYEDMTSNLTKLDDVIGSDSEKLNADGVYFLRMYSAALTDSGTGNFSNLNSSYKIKTGDLVLDSGRKLYQIVSVDSANETFTVGNSLFKVTAESDLAAVATSGDYGDLDNKPNLSAYDQHLANTDIHVTTADKSKWNNGVSQSYVLRYSSSSVTDNSTIAYSTLDNTDNIKSGDKVIDVDGKIFSVVSVDTANQTVSVGSALIDLALDANVMHLSGNESVSGDKNFKGLITTVPNSTLWPIDTNTSADITSLGGTAIHLEYKASGKLTDLSGGAWSVVELGEGCFFFRINNGTDIRYKHFPTNLVNRIYVVNGANRHINDLIPDQDNTRDVGSNSLRWATFNGINPGALFMPDLSNGVDISSYITVVANANKESLYTPPANGWISVALTRTGGVNMAVLLKQGNFASSGHNIQQQNGTTTCNAMLPVKGGVQVSINSALADGIDFAYFYPCLGNV